MSTTAWEVVEGPEEWIATGDGRRFRYRLERDGERRGFDVHVSGMVLTAQQRHGLADERGEAARTRGRSIVDRFLSEDVPPRRVRVDVNGIMPLYGRGIAAPRATDVRHLQDVGDAGPRC